MSAESLFQSRLYLKYILAASVVELFPGTQLVFGKVDETGFEYQFQFLSEIQKVFSDPLLERIEDQMRLILSRKEDFKFIEMMRENAQHFFNSKGQRVKAEEIGECEYNIVPLVQLGQFYDSFEEGIEFNYSKTHFKLIGFSVLKDNTIKIRGIGFEEKKDLKNYLKKYENSKRNDHCILGSELGLFIDFEENYFFLPKGFFLKNSIINFIKNGCEELGYGLIETPSHMDPLDAHYFIFNKTSEQRFLEIRDEVQEHARVSRQGLYALNNYKKIYASCFCQKKQLDKELISSLQFIQKTIKIFGFEFRLEITKSAKEAKEFIYNELPSSLEDGISHIQFYLLDHLGNGWQGPSIEIIRDVDQVVLLQCLLPSVEAFMALLLEYYAGDFPIWISPEQVRILPIGKEYVKEAQGIASLLHKESIRLTIDQRMELSLSERIYGALKEKVPYIILFGKKEKEWNKEQISDTSALWVTVRKGCKQEEKVELGSWVKAIFSASRY